MSNGIAYAMNASGHFRVSVTIEGKSKRVRVSGKIWKNPVQVCPTSFSLDFSDGEVLTDPGTERWLSEITGAKQTTKWEF